MRTHDGEPQQQGVGVAAAVSRIFVREFCVVISLVFLFLLHLVCVGLVGCRLVCHPACGDVVRDEFTAAGKRKIRCTLVSVADSSNVKTLDLFIDCLNKAFFSCG